MNYKTSIESIALESKFSKENIPALLTIINATENPQTTLQILLGIYDYPDIFLVANDSKDEKERTFSSFEPISSKVTYSYYPVTTKEAWFKTGEENLSKENIVSTKYWASGVADEFGITEEKVKELYENKIYETNVGTNLQVRSVSLITWNQFGQYVPTMDINRKEMNFLYFEPEEIL